MESTGSREKIQLSEATAELLRSSGRSDWVKARDHGVMAKGKGVLTTYWLLPRISGVSSSNGESRESSQMDSSTFGGDKNGAQNKTLPPGLFKKARSKSNSLGLSDKSSRLVHWNVSLLIKLLKKVASSRNGLNVTADTTKKVRQLEKKLVQESSILEEVQESIRVSGNNSGENQLSFMAPSEKKAISLKIDDATDATVPEIVEKELTRYVTTVASLHPENPFHNVSTHSAVFANSNMQLILTIV